MPEFDAEKVLDLLEVVHKTKELPTLSVLNQAAMVELTKVSRAIAEQLAKEEEEARKKAEAEAAAKAAASKAQERTHA